jgi:hypothetical protein
MQWGDQLEEGDKTFNQFIDAFVDGTGKLKLHIHDFKTVVIISYNECMNFYRNV